ELVEPLPELREERAGGDRRDDGVGRLPAELLDDLEREGLRALGVVGAQVDVDEAPLDLARELGDEPRAVVVAAAHAVDARAVDRRGLDLLRLETRRAEDDGRHPERRRARGDGAGEVAGRGAGEGVEPELLRLRGRDGDDAVLEGVR